MVNKKEKQLREKFLKEVLEHNYKFENPKPKFDLFKPMLELIMIGTALLIFIMVAQIAHKGCHSVDFTKFQICLYSSVITYIWWRNLK